jgi:replicative DNA helicase
MSYELHDQVLGMVLDQPERYWPQVKNKWNPEVFLELSRIKIARAIKEIFDENLSLNITILCDKVPGEALIIERIKSSYAMEANIEWFMNQITSWYNVKNVTMDLSDLANNIITAKYTDKIENVINKTKKIFEKIEGSYVGGDKLDSMEQLLDSTTRRLEEVIEMKSNGKTRGLATGNKKIDDHIGGFVPGRFYIIAARTSVGKTSFATWLCLKFMKNGAKPLFFSNEMDKEDLLEKMIACDSKVNTQKIQTGNLSDDELTRFVASANNIAKLHIAIDEKSGWDLDSLISRVHQMHRLGKCDIVFVDYLQQVRVKSSNSKHEQVSEVSDAMKKLSRELNIPVVGLAQINRESEKGGKDEVPLLSHLKDSGSLEQDADVVMILHKRDIADQETILRISKNRIGRPGPIKIKHIHEYNNYESV